MLAGARRDVRTDRQATSIIGRRRQPGPHLGEVVLWLPATIACTENAASAGSITILARSEDESARWLAAIQGPHLVQCLQERFDHELTLTAPPAVRPTPSRGKALPFPALGDGTAAIRVQASLPNDVEGITLSTDFVFVRSGPFELVLIFTNTPAPFPADIASRVGEELAAKAQGAGP